MLRHWTDLTRTIRIEMASADKRQAGGTVAWLGILSNSVVGTIVVPLSKTLRAISTLRDLTDPSTTVLFRDHRRLTGLLEHIIGVVHARRLVMYGLYEPHGRLRDDPEGIVSLTPLGHATALAWIDALISTPGRHCAVPDAAPAPPLAPHAATALARRFLIYTDAAKEGAVTPCLGGWCHGLFFSLPIPDGLRGYPIPQLELLGIICATYVFADATAGCLTDLISDSDTSVKVISNDGAHHPEMQWLHLEYDTSNARHRTVDGVRHARGDLNAPADLASRGRLPELLSLAAHLGIKPVRLPVPDGFLDVLRRFEAAHGSRPAEGSRRSAATLALEGRRGNGFTSDVSGDGPRPQTAPVLARDPRTPSKSNASAHSAAALALEGQHGSGFPSDDFGDGPPHRPPSQPTPRHTPRAPAPPHRPRPAPCSPRAPQPQHRPLDFDRPSGAPSPPRQAHRPSSFPMRLRRYHIADQP